MTRRMTVPPPVRRSAGGTWRHLRRGATNAAVRPHEEKAT